MSVTTSTRPMMLDRAMVKAQATSSSALEAWCAACTCTRPACKTLLSNACCVQYKLADSRSKLPPRGFMLASMLECVPVPAMSSFSHPTTTWWGEMGAADEDKPMKALWRCVDKSVLPDKTIAPAFPGAPGCKTDWEAQKQELVDGFNAGQVPDQFVHVGRWPDEVDALYVYPGLKRIAKQQRLIMRAPRALWLLRVGLAPGARAAHGMVERGRLGAL